MGTSQLVRLISSLLSLGCVAQSWATGYFGPAFYLEDGGRRIAASPEFYWELETKRLAKDFHPIEKLRPGGPAEKVPGLGEVDAADFAAALAEKRIAPPDPVAARNVETAARKVLEQTDETSPLSLPAEFPSEFADYHRGAFAYRRGRAHWPEAREAWQNLLQRPESERHYRTVWAAFMLGKMAMKQNDPAAVEWFERVRTLAASGFADSLGMAADSYGWEGRCQWKLDHPEKAAPLFLTQLALGDESAIVSLKALVPDRQPVDRMLNYGPEPEERSRWRPEQLQAAKEKADAQLQRAARDPLLRRLITAHILALASAPEEFFYEKLSDPDRSQRWLQIIDALKLSKVEDAEYLGWVAYNGGDYKSAAHWLDLASAESPAALWLRAKLQRREGHFADAAKSMARAWQTLRDPAAYTGWNGLKQEIDTIELGEHWTFPQSASGDLGALRLERGDFVQSLETLLDGDLWDDAAFVAERVLTTSELAEFVEAHPADAKPGDWQSKLRYLLGRRLVREDRYADAAKFIPAPWNAVLQKYVSALATAQDGKRPKEERARAYFSAAWLARHAGMELMGTESAPDGFTNRGLFPMPDLVGQIRAGHYTRTSYENGQSAVSQHATVLHLPAAANRRLTRSQTSPDLRFHYRVIAGALAIDSAKLLPNDREELADVINCAGLWVKEEDERLGNRYFDILERRAAKTVIGRAAIARRWFVEQTGPWSDQAKQAEAAMKQELQLPEH